MMNADPPTIDVGSRHTAQDARVPAHWMPHFARQHHWHHRKGLAVDAASAPTAPAPSLRPSSLATLLRNRFHGICCPSADAVGGANQRHTDVSNHGHHRNAGKGDHGLRTTTEPARGTHRTVEYPAQTNQLT
jgi:hypothetical protein